MAMRLNERAILRDWDSVVYTDLSLLLKSALPPEEAAGHLRQACAAAGLYPPIPARDPVVPMPKGAVLFHPGRFPQRRDVLETIRPLARELDILGVDGELTVPGFDDMGEPEVADADCFSAGVFLPARWWYEPTDRPNLRAALDSRFAVDPQIQERVLQHALDWVRVPNGQYFYNFGTTNLACTAEDLPVLSRACNGELNDRILRCMDGSREVRRVRLLDEGAVIYDWRSETAGTEAVLDGLTRVLADFSDVAPFGMVKRDYLGGSGMTIFLEQYWIFREDFIHNWIHMAHDLLPRYIPDPYGIQLLSRTHDQSVVPATWQKTPAANGSVIVSQRDKPGWFSLSKSEAAPVPGQVKYFPRKGPDEDLLNAARDDFRDLLLTSAILRDRFETFTRNPAGGGTPVQDGGKT